MRPRFLVVEEGVPMVDAPFTPLGTEGPRPRVTGWYTPIVGTAWTRKRAELLCERALDLGYCTARVVELPERPDRRSA